MGTIQIKKINGKEYAYEFFSYRDKKTKKVKKKCVYLGKVIDKENKIYEKHIAKAKIEENMLLNFGDSYSILEFLKITQYYQILKETFKEDFEMFLSLVLYKMLNTTAMRYADIWLNGNYASQVLKNINLSSQRISEFFERIGKESVHRRFFKKYLKIFDGQKINTLVDSTGLPNHIDFSLNAWSNHNGKFEEETRLLYVIDRNTGMPTYFRYMAGNIVDVTTLNNTIEEMKQYNVGIDYSIIDAGYYSENNIKSLYGDNISFLTRLPSNRKLYKELIKKYGKEIEKKGRIVTYGQRTMYIKKAKIDLFGNIGYAYIILDVKRYADEANKYIIVAKDDKKDEKEIREELQNKGKLILISSEEIELDEVVPLYYTRQRVENIFGVLKSEVNILPLRVHKVNTFRGYILLNFITLIIELLLQKQLGIRYTLDEYFITTRNLMCKVYEKDIIVDEPSPKIKEIFELLHIEYQRKLPR